jgi:hypothetical protein
MTLTQRITLGLILAALLSACGSSMTMTPQDTRRTSTFSGTLDDPTRCTCAPGALGAFTVQPNASGRLDAVATVQPADAQLVVRLLDSSLNTVHVVSTQTGATAALNFTVAPGTYAIQVFLASDGPRQASYSLSVTYP